MNSNLPSGTVTFLFTDIEGSTKLAQGHPGAWEALSERHDTILNSVIASHNGYVFQIIGDAFCAAFHTAGDAVRAAVQSQVELNNENWGDAPIKVRMGIHTGKAEINEDGLYQGYMSLSRAQRLMSAGHGGQTLLSLATQELVHDELPEGVELSDMGEWQLKDLIRPMHIYQLLIPDLPTSFAPLRSTLAVASREDENTPLLDRIVRGKLIGRERELAEANLCWQRTVIGEGQALLVSGEPGVGKTRFTHEVVTQAKFNGAIVLSGECYAEGGAPYAPIAKIIQDAFAQTPTLPTALPAYVLADLLSLSPVLRARYADAPSNPLMDNQTEQERIYDSVVELCTRVSLRTPLVLFVEDVHWADPGTLSLLRHLARRSRAALQKPHLRLMIVVTYREMELDEARALNEVLLDLNRERLATRIKLTRLSKERTRDMLTVMFAEETTPEFLEGIFRETEGNPFFIEEVCKALIDAGKLTYADGRWHRPKMDEIEIPQSLRLAIQTRIGQLPSNAREALALASIIGREFDFETLLRSSDQDEDTLIESLESATRAQLIEELKDKGGEKYSFVHALIPTTLYEGISGRRRRHAHERVANTIEALFPNDFEALAYHFAAADDAGKAVEYSLSAARRAESLYAYEAAVRHLRVALDFVESDQPELRRDLLEQLADILSTNRTGTEAIPLYQEAITLWRPLDDGSRKPTIRLHRKIIEASIRMYQWEDVERLAPITRETLEAGLELVEDQPPDEDTVQLLIAISRRAWLNQEPPDWDSAERHARRAVEMAEQLGSPVEITDALSALNSVYGARGLFRERVEIELRKLELSRDPRFTDIRRRINILYQAGEALVYVGEYTKAMPHLLEAEKLASQIEDLDRQFTVLRVQSHCLYQMDQWDQVIKIDEKWRALDKRYPNFFKLVYSRCFQVALNATVHARRGELKQAEALQEESRAIMLAEDGSVERFGRAGYY